jgi:gliding motility-associated-like protein
MKYLFTLLGFTIALTVSAQQPLVTITNGGDVHITNGGLMVVVQDSMQNLGGTLDNAGTLEVQGNFKNSGTSTGFATGTGLYRIYGDFENNNTFIADQSTVELYNTNLQYITGSATTTFYNLNLTGGNSIKRQTVDAATANALALNNVELATDVNEMLVTNPATNSVTWANGYVSSAGPGRFSRATNATAPYFYQIGYPSYLEATPPYIRPIEYTPNTANPNVYGATLVHDDATNQGYDVTVMDDILCSVNPNFYHRLYHTVGADPTALKMFYLSSDGDWRDNAHWDAPNRWNQIANPTQGAASGYNTVSVPVVSDFNPEPFALASRKFLVDAGNNIQLTEGQTVQLTPIIGTPAVTNIAWTPDLGLSCADCEEPDATPPATTLYYVTVTDINGCKVTDSLLISILPGDLLIPTAFSPNGDGANDIFRSLNKNLSKYNLQVWNRWGEKIFETTDIREGWDGVYEGMAQEMGVYVWKCEYTLSGDTKGKTASGNVTLVR